MHLLLATASEDDGVFLVSPDAGLVVWTIVVVAIVLAVVLLAAKLRRR